jgi:hypothetical protein
MSGAFPPKVVAAGEGKTVMLFGVRFGYKVVSGDSGGRLAVLEVEIPPRTLVKPRGVPHARWNAGSTPATVAEILSPAGLEEYFEKLAPILAAHRPAAEYYQLAEDYGITIQDDWIEELERTYGVKL